MVGDLRNRVARAVKGAFDADRKAHGASRIASSPEDWLPEADAALRTIAEALREPKASATDSGAIAIMDVADPDAVVEQAYRCWRAMLAAWLQEQGVTDA